MRGKIYEVVKDRPGIHLRGLEREAECSTGTVYHHIRKDQRLQSRDIRGYRRIYTRKVPSELHSSLAALNHEKRGSIISHLYMKSRRSTSEISRSLEIPLSTASKHLKVLREENIVKASVKGRKKYYRNTEITIDALRRFGGSIISEFTDRFIDTWEQL